MTKDTKDRIIEKIAWRLDGLNKEDMTTAERQIANILVETGNVYFDDNGDLLDTGCKQQTTK